MTSAALSMVTDDQRRMLWQQFERAPKSAREEAARRLEIVRSIAKKSEHGLGLRASIVEASAAPGAPSERTIWRWYREITPYEGHDWLAALAPRQWGHEQPRADYDEGVWDRFKALYLSNSRRSFAESYRLAIRARYQIDPPIKATGEWPGRPASAPTLMQLRRRLGKEIRREAIILARSGRQALRREHPHQTRDHSVFRAMEAVNADGRRSKCYVVWEDGTRSRPVIISISDIYSGKRVAWRADRSENRETLRMAIHDMARDFGLPRLFYIDNTRAMANKWLTGHSSFRFRWRAKEEDPVGLMRALGIDVHFVMPESGESKPIERQHRDDIAHLDRHPALAGAMAEKGAVPIEFFRRVMDETYRAENARRGRTGRLMAGRSQDEVFAESYACGPVRRPTEQQLRLCILAADSVAVRADGQLDFFGNRYYCEAAAGLAGRRCMVRFDPEHLHDGVHLYTMETGAYVGHAQCLLPQGFADSAAARELARRRRVFLKNAKTALEMERRMDEISVAQELSGLAADKAIAPPRITQIFAEPRWARATRSAPPPAIRPDRAEIEREYERALAERDRGEKYSEEREIAIAIARYDRLMATPRDRWTTEDDAWFELAQGLPEIQGRRAMRAVLPRVPAAEAAGQPLGHQSRKRGAGAA